MQDRLAELRKLANVPEDSSKDVEAGQSGDGGSGFMAEYFRQIGQVKNSMNTIRTNTDRIRRLKDQAVKVTLPEHEKKISNELQQIVDETNAQAQVIKQKLEAMKADNDAYSEKHKGSSEARIRVNMQQTTTRKFKDYLKEYQEVQNEFKTKVRAKVERQVKIAEPDATPEQVAEVVQSGDVAGVFRSKIMDVGHEKLRNAVADIQDKYRDIRKLEQSVAELHQTFLDLALLVESQGELLDQIEYSVSQAKEYTEKAEIELIKAKKSQKQARKKMCCIIIILIIVLVAILWPTLNSLDF